jgi:sec-independent protein translocase protein TatA
MRLLEPWHLLIITVVLVAVFGARRLLPESARALGRSLHVFRKAVHEPPTSQAPTGTDRDPAGWGDCGWPY